MFDELQFVEALGSKTGDKLKFPGHFRDRGRNVIKVTLGQFGN